MKFHTKLSAIAILLLCIGTACMAADPSGIATAAPPLNGSATNGGSSATASPVAVAPDASAKPLENTFAYTAQEGDTFFNIAAALYPDKDLSAAAVTLQALNPSPIVPGTDIICPKKEDIPDTHIVLAWPSGAFENSDYYHGAKDANNHSMTGINQELGIETTDFLVVRCQGVHPYFRPVDANADAVLYAYQKDGKWGLINGLARVVLEPAHAMVTTLGRNQTSHYLVSDDKDKPFTGLLYTADGQQVFDFAVGLIGGGPDCNTPHIRTDVFTYEENGKLGIVTIGQDRVTPAIYDAIRDDVHGAFMLGYQGGITGFLTPEGTIPTPHVPGLSLMGIGDGVVFAYSCAKDLETNETTVYKGRNVVFKTPHLVAQIEGGFLEFSDNGTTVYDPDFNKLHHFPKEYVYLLAGPEGAYSYAGYLMFEKGGKHLLCDKNGKELISMDQDKWFSAVPEGAYLRISTDGSPDGLYDLEGNFVKEAESRKEEPHTPSSFFTTAFHHDNQYYRRHHEGWFDFVTEDFTYTLPYSAATYLATRLSDMEY